MPYNVNRDSGIAERLNKMQLSLAEVAALTAVEGSSSLSPNNKKFAELVYQVNSPPVVISGDVVIDSVGLDGSGTVKLSGDQLKTFDQGVIDAINNQSTTVSLTAVGLNGDGDVKLSGDQLKTFDQAAINRLIEIGAQVVELQQAVDTLSGTIINDNYSRVLQERGEDVYFAHAVPGTSTSTSAWRVKKIDTNGDVLWADNANFTQPANIELSALAYTY